jgi:hypothetical protein
MVAEHFYLKNDEATLQYTKINFEDVIMVHSVELASFFYLASGQNVIKIRSTISISDCYVKYFTRADEFIRSSPEYIVNVNHIVGAAKPKNGYLALEMKGGNKALLRLSHLYAQKIIRSSDKKGSSFAALPRTAIDSIRKDEIILEYPNVMQAKKKIREELDEKVTAIYIRQRVRILLSYKC